MTKLSSFTKDWKADDYLHQYFSGNKMNSDEAISLKYLVNFFKKTKKIFRQAIDVGSGPTLHQIIPLIPYVEELHLADFLPENLQKIKQWLNNDRGAHNWDTYIQYVIDLEGRGESVQERKTSMRKKITKLLPVDVYRHHPLGLPKTYPLVTSFFCADSVTKNKTDWKRCTTNIFTLAEPHGTIVLAALRNADSYQVLSRHFPSPHVNENDFKDLFENHGEFKPGTIDIQVMAVSERVADGYDSAILAKGERNAKIIN